MWPQSAVYSHLGSLLWRLLADPVLTLIKMKCGLIAYAQVMQLKRLAASGYRDVTLLPASFTVNNQEATPWYCSHNCDLCLWSGQKWNWGLFRDTMSCDGSHSWGRPAVFHLEHVNLLLLAWWHHLAQSRFTVHFKGWDSSVCSVVAERVCVENERYFEVKKKEQSWFRVY